MLPEVILGSSKIHGRGLFATHDYVEGSFLTEYAGEYVSKTDDMRMIEEGTNTYLLSISRTQF